MGMLAAAADIVRMSDIDFTYLYGNQAATEWAHSMLARGAGLIVITRGTQGAQVWHRKVDAIDVSAPAVKVVDTIGAGDSFQAALLFALARLKRIERASLQTIGADELRKALAFACQCAALTCTRAGADPPRYSEVAGYW